MKPVQLRSVYSEYVKHTRNCRLGRRGLNKRIRATAKVNINKGRD